jgi:hypothetical protein
MVVKVNDILLNSLKRYYNKESNFEILNNILSNEKNISLRLIDWFVTNYSKKNNIIYLIYRDKQDRQTLDETDTIDKQFNVYDSYKSQLKAYSKKQCDPFCRRERINLTIQNITITTTLGQLNFFKWIIMNNIMDYIHNNMDTIEQDMVLSLKNVKKKSNSLVRKPRQELSKSALRGLNKNKMKISIVFD